MPPRLSPGLLTALAHRLTPRDYTLLQALHDQRLLTTQQVAALFFGRRSSRRARTRLLTLHRLGVLERFRPHTAPGSAPWCWVLASAGVHLLARHRDQPAAELAPRAERALALAHSARLHHHIGVREVLVAATLAARTDEGHRLEIWWDEARCAQEWGTYIRPDAFLRYRHPGGAVDAFLEYDTGTEPLARVAAKLPGYEHLAEATRITTPLLLTTTAATRETNLAERLAEEPAPHVPVWLTTAAQLLDPGPAEPVWRPLRDGPHRSLTDLHRPAAQT
ncbi:replication-relaxation family protein [Streptomonospora wellingtoniae]|uniref:Replication-relaxation family protein n=1 Tax=Streptomonospora wellingtoniae TaxID=3075544 RepID=A0ABU2KYJ6_9ACTN|nr:replication-relaxation family protein [Streptomonospora sp. DSM 45055]MDT0304323.1 replication-relaxation family protein [Streptomonospora sp. DSM 45055]